MTPYLINFAGKSIAFMNGIIIKKKLFTKPAFKITLECPRKFVDFPNSNQHANDIFPKAIAFTYEFFNQHV
jgi:hypothetical protein